MICFFLKLSYLSTQSISAKIKITKHCLINVVPMPDMQTIFFSYVKSIIYTSMLVKSWRNYVL